MPLSAASLASEFDSAIQLADTEAAARAAWASAWTAYFYGAAAGAVPVTPGSLAGAQAAMDAGMTGLSTAGAIAIQTGLAAFWGAVVAGAAAVFPSATLVTPPPGLGIVSAALLPVFLANTSTSAGKETALLAIATALHGVAGLGGTATLPGPTVVPIV